MKIILQGFEDIFGKEKVLAIMQRISIFFPHAGIEVYTASVFRPSPTAPESKPSPFVLVFDCDDRKEQFEKLIEVMCEECKDVPHEDVDVRQLHQIFAGATI